MVGLMREFAILVVDDEPLARRRVVRLAQQLPWVGDVAQAGNVAQAAEWLAGAPCHIILLDIRMPGGSGFDLLRHLPDPAPAVIFVTAFSDQALRAFDAQAVDYVTKPIEAGRFQTAMERARMAVEQKHSADRIRELEEVVATLRAAEPETRNHLGELWVRAGGEYVRIKPESISHISAERDYVRVHVDGNSYLYNENLATLERLLPAFQFQRIHRSTMVRIDAVDRVKAGQFHSLIAVLNDGTELRVGRTYTAAIRARLARRG
ncbi:MAG: response regulator transcription factor [Sphingopyxis sp.]|uniref:LytR/AlgR family response regulator transcription factor n=1 Tax=Sphingopyxis sp. TaxID=1908224 RepID=UPI001A53DEBA|nr:LytTR family DNA-binding domain-containing protein [Sphingopyxis sp.]MBL9068213.1 response regulator transcription factor [Sphingopyxis sp.]